MPSSWASAFALKQIRATPWKRNLAVTRVTSVLAVSAATPLLRICPEDTLATYPNRHTQGRSLQHCYCKILEMAQKFINRRGVEIWHFHTMEKEDLCELTWSDLQDMLWHEKSKRKKTSRACYPSSEKEGGPRTCTHLNKRNAGRKTDTKVISYRDWGMGLGDRDGDGHGEQVLSLSFGPALTQDLCDISQTSVCLSPSPPPNKPRKPGSEGAQMECPPPDKEPNHITNCPEAHGPGTNPSDFGNQCLDWTLSGHRERLAHESSLNAFLAGEWVSISCRGMSLPFTAMRTEQIIIVLQIVRAGLLPVGKEES